jgi:hypothetical protein
MFALKEMEKVSCFELQIIRSLQQIFLKNPKIFRFTYIIPDQKLITNRCLIQYVKRE